MDGIDGISSVETVSIGIGITILADHWGGSFFRQTYSLVLAGSYRVSLVELAAS